MTLGDHEVPASQRTRAVQPGGVELDPADITKTNRPVYMLTIGTLGVALVLGLVGWIVLTMSDKKMPEGLTVLMGTIGGALVGLLTSAPKKK